MPHVVEEHVIALLVTVHCWHRELNKDMLFVVNKSSISEIGSFPRKLSLSISPENKHGNDNSICGKGIDTFNEK